MKVMIRNLAFCSLVLAAGFNFSGCALFLIGAGGATAYGISEDEVEGLTDASANKVFNVLERVLDERGTITSQNATTRIMEAIVNDSEVKTSIEQVTAKSVRFRIKARRAEGLFPHLDLAQEIANDVYQRL